MCASSTKSPRVCGVSSYIGVSGPPRPESPVFPQCPRCGAVLVFSPEGPRKVSGVSGLHRSLRPTNTGVSGPLTPESSVQVKSNG